ncbi:hypothetical protein PG997_007893 [Apiospora hydei]|uniref:Uncharacterized protein n=1 Tax=Apiospora hydei TaxID=1337664 RepID=A0ABR1WC88_9PEZI
MAERLVEVAEMFRTGPAYNFNVVDVQLDASPWDLDPVPGSNAPSFKMPKGARWKFRRRRAAHVDDDDEMKYDPNKDRDCDILAPQLEPRDQWDTATQHRTGVTVLDLAIVRGQADLARRLINLSLCRWRPTPPWAPPVRSNRSSVLHLAARAGMADVVQALIQRGTACDDRAPHMGGFRPLQCAAVREGNIAVIQHLAQRNVPVRYRIRGANPGAAGPRPAAYGTGLGRINDESDHRNMAPLVLALQQGCLWNAQYLLIYELRWLRYEFRRDLEQAVYHTKRRMQQLLLKCVKKDTLLDFTTCILVCHLNPPKNLCLPALRRAEAIARSKPLYSDPDTAPNRRTVQALRQTHARYRPTRYDAVI